MNPLDTHKVNFPAWALPAIANDDTSALTDHELKLIADFKQEWYEIAQTTDGRKPNQVALCNYSLPYGEEFFCTDPEFGKPCSCVEMIISIY